MYPGLYREFLERYIERVPFSGCWIWIASLVGNTGYGKVKYGGATYRAHRLFWELYVGPIPHGLLVLHSCDVKCCVNPNHLYIGTASDNVADVNKRLDPNWGRPKGTKDIRPRRICVS